MTLPVLIVGAGPTGLAAALEMARRGIRARLIDKAPEPIPRVESRALGIHLRTRDILRDTGVAAEMERRGHLVREVVLHRSGQMPERLDLTEHPRGDSGILTLRQWETERLLRSAAEAEGVHVERGVTLTGLADLTGTPEATLSHGDGTEELVRAARVVGADGAHSAVRRAAGIAFAGRTEETHWSLADITYREPVERGKIHMSLGAAASLAVIPVDEHTLRFVGTHPEVADMVDATHDIVDIPWSSTFRISFRMVSRLSKGGVFLIGDAAHIHSPVGGRGMNLGIEDAAWLAWLIAEGREAEFDRLRRPVARKVLTDTAQQTWPLRAQGGLADFARAQGPKLLRLRAVRRAVLTRVLALDTPPPPWLNG
ncbi:MAG: FAD-dependent monooxygenase [Pseudomonadota bacterium]